MPWILETYSGGLVSATYNVIDNSRAIVSCDLQKLNESKLICSTLVGATINVDTEVKVIDIVINPETKVELERRTLLHGFVEKYSQVTKGATHNTHEYSIKELAGELEKFRVHLAGTTNYTVPCPAQNTSAYAASIFVDTAWTVAAGVVNQALQAIQFRYMTGLAALNKIVTNLTAASAATPLYMWFNNDTKEVAWGEYRNDRTSVNFTKALYYNYKEEKTIKNQVEGVVIYGANSAYSGHWPDPLPGTSHQLAVYQYDDATTDAECTEIAKSVYLTWCNDPKRRIQFWLRPMDAKVGGNYLLEGDRIQVDGVNYTIIDMTHSPNGVLIGVNAGEDSVLYSLGDKLRPVAGTATGASEVTWPGGLQHVGTGEPAIYYLEISDIADVSSPTIPMTVTIGPYKIYELPESTSISNQLLSTVTVPSGFQDDTAVWNVKDGDVSYIPSGPFGNWMETTSQVNGFQYAIATLQGNIVNEFTDNGLGGGVFMTCCYSYNNVQWYEGSYQYKVVLWDAKSISGTTVAFWQHFSCTFIVPGKTATTKLYVKWKLRTVIQPTPTGSGFNVRYVTGTIDVIPRHTHDLQQVGQPVNTVKPDVVPNVTETEVEPPSYVLCSINGGSAFSVYNETPIDILTGKGLTSGRNEISFSTPGNVCTVSPSAVYEMFGA